MSSKNYSNKQYAAFKQVYVRFHKMDYPELKKLAEEKFNDTEHPQGDVQIGVNVLYDDKKLGHVRCFIALFTVKEQPWWHFWDSAVLSEDFIITPDGTFIGE